VGIPRLRSEIDATDASGRRLVRPAGRRGAWPSARVHRAAFSRRSSRRPSAALDTSEVWALGAIATAIRERRLDRTFGPLVLAVPRARLADGGAGAREWKSTLLPAYRRLSRRAQLLIAEVYLAGVNTRRVHRALQSPFAGCISKDAVRRAWHKTRGAWEARQQRDEDIVRVILNGTVSRSGSIARRPPSRC
jgi:mutator family transposase